jgi:hypothetical protein
MTDFLQMLIDCDDFETLLGDMYQPACACIVISWAILSFGAVCQIFSTLVTGLFKQRL